MNFYFWVNKTYVHKRNLINDFYALHIFFESINPQLQKFKHIFKDEFSWPDFSPK